MATTTAEPQAIPEIQSVPEQQLESKNVTADAEKNEAAAETASIEDAPKGYYSKLSVWLMVLFSGLAIGSDG